MASSGDFSLHGVETTSLTQLTARLGSTGVSAGSVLRRVNPLHPEGLCGSYSGLPCPYGWKVSGQRPPDYTFPPQCDEAQA